MKDSESAMLTESIGIIVIGESRVHGKKLVVRSVRKLEPDGYPGEGRLVILQDIRELLLDVLEAWNGGDRILQSEDLGLLWWLLNLLSKTSGGLDLL